MQGFLLLDKPKGITSFGAVSKIKWLIKEKRVGHTGTLDPLATGVLPIFIGKATSLSSYLSEKEKTYTAKLKLGITTDTLDITGKVLSENAVFVSEEDVNKAVLSFIGKQKQTPPMFSAIKKDGVKMYELARKGETVEIPQRDIEIFDISVITPIDKHNEIEFSATVSKGTYIRSLARDIGELLGCGAVLTELRRTKVSGFSVNDCVSLDMLNGENIKDYIRPEETAISQFENIEVSYKQAVRFTNGGQLDFERLTKKDLYDGQILKVFYNGTFLGLGVSDFEKNQLAVKCIINKQE